MLTCETRFPLCVIGVTLIGLAVVTSEQVSGPPPRPDRIDELVWAHNAIRVRYKLPPFEPDPILTAIAQAQAERMARVGRLEYGPTGAENVGRGFATVDGAMAGWLACTGQRAHILGAYTRMGAAVARARDGTDYWCVLYSGGPR